MKLSLGKKIAGAALAGAVLVGAGTVAYAATSSGATGTPPVAVASTTGPAASGTAGTGLGAAAARVAQLVKRADHGTVEVKAKSAGSTTATWQTFTFDRGQVSAVSATSITLARPDGQSVTLSIGANVKYKGVTSWQGIATSKGAVVISQSGGALIIAQKAGTSTPATTSPSTTPAA